MIGGIKMSNYIKQIRDKSIELKEKYGITYISMSKHSNVSYQIIKNFVSGYRDSMGEDNWNKFSKYIEKMWNLFNEEGKYPPEKSTNSPGRAYLL